MGGGMFAGMGMGGMGMGFGGSVDWRIHHEGRDGSGSCGETACKYFMKSGHCGAGHFKSCGDVSCKHFMKHVNPGHMHEY